MRWRTAIANAGAIDPNAANLLDALERARPICDLAPNPPAIGRWLIESWDEGAIADDSVVWLHRMLVR